MREYDATTAAWLASGQHVIARSLVWISARNRDTLATETIGFWTGDDHREFTINGSLRTYFGAGAALDVPAFVYQTGLDVRMHTISLAGVAPEVEQAIRGYEPRLAPVEVHRALFSPDTMNLVAEPHRVFRGTIDEISYPTPEIGGDAVVSVSVASASRTLTRTLTLMKSDNAQRLRGGDRFRRYADVSGAVEVKWGS